MKTILALCASFFWFLMILSLISFFFNPLGPKSEISLLSVLSVLFIIMLATSCSIFYFNAKKIGGFGQRAAGTARKDVELETN